MEKLHVYQVESSVSIDNFKGLPIINFNTVVGENDSKI